MIKRGLIGCFMLFVMLFSISMVSADVGDLCELSVSLLSQDPHPAMPGEYVKLVFQVDGVDDPKCGEIIFELKEDFPISLDPGVDAKIVAQGGIHQIDFSSYLLASYEARVSEDALDGENIIEVEYSYNVGGSRAEEVKQFNLNVEDARVDFEVYVKDYDPTTKVMTFEILNIGDSDIEALTIEVPRQDHIEIKGPNRNIVGDLDSNEYTTAEFEATSEGGNIELEIIYTDTINVRRSISKTIIFTPEYFEGRNGNEGTSVWVYVIVVVVVVGLVWYWRKKKKYRMTHKRR